MKIAFTGPSGSGKTTLVKFVEKEFGIPWLNGSSGELKSEADTTRLAVQGLVQQHGHRAVIVSGHNNPTAAVANQHKILTRRNELMAAADDFVTDRSQVDNWVYYWMQCSMHVKDEDATWFRKECEKGLDQNVTHLIFVPTMLNPIEDNKSRIASFHYQKMVSILFEFAIAHWDFGDSDLKPLMLDMMDLEERKEAIRHHLKQ
jgi:hypothetical protein